MAVQAHRYQYHGLSQSPQQPQHQYFQDFNSSIEVSCSSPSLFEKQRQEIDHFIALQNEKLRLSIQERRRQHHIVLLKRLESISVGLLKQKEDELTKAKRKKEFLEDCIRRAEMETQAWETVAKENESMVIALNNTLEQVRENASCLAIGTVEDAESCCCEVQESKEEETDRKFVKKMTCKGCNTRKSCVLFLPCRHLCCCKDCESLLDYCPVCKSVKNACIDVFLT